MKLIAIKDRINRTQYININHITRVFEQTSDTLTIILSDGGSIETKLSYSEFLELVS